MDQEIFVFDLLQNTFFQRYSVYGQKMNFWSNQIFASQIRKIHIIATVVISPTRNDAIYRLNIHFTKKKIECINVDFAIVNKTNHFPYPAVAHGIGNFL